MSNLNLAQFEETIWAKDNTSQFQKASSGTKIKSSPSIPQNSNGSKFDSANWRKAKQMQPV